MQVVKHLYGSAPLYSSPLAKLWRGYRYTIPLSSDSFVIKVKNGSSDTSISEEELAIIAIAIKMYKETKKKNGNGITHNSGNGDDRNTYTNSPWLSRWIFETVNTNIHSLLRYNTVNINHKMRYQMVDGQDTSSWDMN